MIGQKVNNYEVTSLLGEGGMGAVYVAEHPVIDRKVAVKVLRRELATDKALVARFINEAKAANVIRHPNIVEIHDVGTLPDGIPYIMMELLSGESLGARLERAGRLGVDQTIDIILQAAGALAAAHAANIVHRDLKPDNLFLSPATPRTASGREIVKVLDFGIAKIRRDMTDSKLTSTGSLMGTPAYMSPEQCRGIPSEIDHRTDIYALGIIAYQMLCGQPPFMSDGVGDILIMHLTAPPQPLREINPEVPEHVEQAILAALAKDKKARPQSMEELAAALTGGAVGTLSGFAAVPAYMPALGSQSYSAARARSVAPTAASSTGAVGPKAGTLAGAKSGATTGGPGTLAGTKAGATGAPLAGTLSGSAAGAAATPAGADGRATGRMPTTFSTSTGQVYAVGDEGDEAAAALLAKKKKQRNLIIGGGAAGAVALVTVLVLALGGSKPSAPTVSAAGTAVAAPAPAAAPAALPTPVPAPAPAPQEAPKAEPTPAPEDKAAGRAAAAPAPDPAARTETTSSKTSRPRPAAKKAADTRAKTGATAAASGATGTAAPAAAAPKAPSLAPPPATAPAPAASSPAAPATTPAQSAKSKVKKW